MRITIDQKKAEQYMTDMMAMMKEEKIEPPIKISGSIPEMLQALAMRSDIAKAMMPMQKALYFHGQVERDIKEKIFVRVSKLNKCQFCTMTHTKALEKFHLSEESENEPEKVALIYAEQVIRDANAVSDELFTRLKKSFNEGEIIELTLAIGMINQLNKFNNALQIRFRED